MPYLLEYLCFSQVCYKVNFSEGNSTLPVTYITQFETVYKYISFMRAETISFFFPIADMVPAR